MTLREKQSKFAWMLVSLLTYMREQGYEVTFGDFWAFPFDAIIQLLERILVMTKFPGLKEVIKKLKTKRHHHSSCHYLRLAADLNLFKDGKYMSKTSDHLIFGEFWESIGGTWGGRFNDGNHYSLEHNGRK